MSPFGSWGSWTTRPVHFTSERALPERYVGTRRIMASGAPTFKGRGLRMKRPEREMFDVSEASSGSVEPTSTLRKRGGIWSDCRGLTRFSSFCMLLSWRERRGRREYFSGGDKENKPVSGEVKY